MFLAMRWLLVGILVEAVTSYLLPLTPASTLAGRHHHQTSALGTASCGSVRVILGSRREKLAVRMAGGPAAPGDGKVNDRFKEVMEDCKDWGLVRWITINANGAVLETAAKMGLKLSFFEIPGKGNYATIASSDKLFECHVNLDKAQKLTFSEEPAKVGGHPLYVMRIKDASDGILLSCMLQYDPEKGPGQYFTGSVDAFKRVQSKYGAEMALK
uniref:Uncharacterized protein n=1 Tax=Hanusia phi TaxID=3032 RepID=A0A7S0HRF5_9CRYP|mmetsp:Transcript_3683/g.9124  ORF Transcript_3683/g.9124 Transcript_3683/m.9124 type:complete len:214 (+) Transcript_3683:3-644(+)